MLAELIGGNRWRPIAAVGAVIVIAAISFFAAAGGGSTRLPAPPHVAAAARSSHVQSSQPNQGDTYTQVDSAPLTGCSASVSNPKPSQGATAETVSVVAVAGGQVRVEADYAHTRSVHAASADSSGKASVSLPINDAAPGVTVPVKVTASLATTKVTCSSSFTPVAANVPATLTPVSLFPAVTKLLPGAPTLAQLPALPPPTNPGAPPPPVVPNPPPPPPTPPPPATLTVSTSSLPAGQVGTPYSVQLQSTGGTPPVSWTISPLPPGLTATTGLISGTPTTAGSAAVTVTATDSGSPAQTASATLTLNIAPASPPPPATLTVSTSSLPAGQVGTPYSVQLQSTGGTPPVSWTISPLPPGLTATTGLISGTPTTAGSAPVTVTATDSGSPAQTASATLTLTIAA